MTEASRPEADHPLVDALGRCCATPPADACARDQLVDALGPLGPEFDVEQRRAARLLYTLLADGQPVAARELAAATGWAAERARTFLDDLSDAERDAEGRVVGFGGLTLRPTPHRLVFGGTVAYTWCAWDTLFLPVVLDTTVAVASTCPQTGNGITLDVSPARILRRAPEATVISFVRPDDDTPADLRGRFCALIHFFADAGSAAAWTSDVPATFVLDLDDAFDIGRKVVRERYGARD